MYAAIKSIEKVNDTNRMTIVHPGITSNVPVIRTGAAFSPVIVNYVLVCIGTGDAIGTRTRAANAETHKPSQKQSYAARQY